MELFLKNLPRSFCTEGFHRIMSPERDVDVAVFFRDISCEGRFSRKIAGWNLRVLCAAETDGGREILVKKFYGERMTGRSGG
jgi:hypothetical protein